MMQQPDCRVPTQTEPPEDELEEWPTPEQGPSGRKGEYAEQVRNRTGYARIRAVLICLAQRCCTILPASCEVVRWSIVRAAADCAGSQWLITCAASGLAISWRTVPG